MATFYNFCISQFKEYLQQYEAANMEYCYSLIKGHIFILPGNVKHYPLDQRKIIIPNFDRSQDKIMI